MRRGSVAAALAPAGFTGCGRPSADLLVIDRGGNLPDARVTLRIGDGGTVRCGGAERTLPNDLLLDARDLTRDVQPLLERNARLPIPPTAILRYRVTGEGGGVRFADASPRLPAVLGRLIRFTRAVATRSCGLDR